MYKKIILLLLVLTLVISGIYWFFFATYFTKEERMFEYSFCEYEDEHYRQRYKPYVKEVYTRFLKQESKYVESMGFPVKFELKELGVFGGGGAVSGFYISVRYSMTRYSAFNGSFHRYIATLKRYSDFFEGELRLLSSLGVYPFVVPIDTTEESSFLLFPYRENHEYRSKE